MVRAQRTVRRAQAESWGARQWTVAHRSASTENERLLVFDLVASRVGPLILQFVDDSTTQQSTLRGVATVCRCLEAFVQSWQLNVAGGKKRPKLLTVGAPPIGGE